MNSHVLRLLFAFLVLTPGLGRAQDDVFAVQNGQSLTQTELDAAFSRIPDPDRLTFIRDGERVDQLVQNLLRTRLIAADARDAGFDQQALVRDRLNLALERELALAWLEQVMANAPAADYAALAEEYYLGHPDEFMTPEVLDVSHILISSENRSSEQALELIAEVQALLAEDPSRFDELVKQYSEDPAKETNDGRYARMKRGDMVRPFEQAAFALRDPGTISQPVETSYGYHLIRLNQRMTPEPIPFEQVKDQLMVQAEERHLAAYRKRYVADLASEPIEIPEGAVESMVRRHFGENFELAPDYYQRRPD